VQQKPQVPDGQPKSPQAEQEKHDQEKKKQAYAAVDLGR
jgi:hypothetical protein